MNRILLLFAGQGSAALLVMLRNLCLARLIGLESYGTAMAIAMALAIVELITNLGIPQQIVSQPNGAHRQMQAALHGAQILRGCVGGLILLAAAQPLAVFLNAPDLAWMIAVSALSPLCLGLSHLDVYRAQRHRRHGPQVALLVIPSAVSVTALWPLSFWITGPELMLTLIAIQTLATTALSHMLAMRRYTIAWSSKQALTLLKYGIPLAGNGVLLCAVLHLEKLVAGHVLGLSALAVIAMGAALTMTPALTATRGFQAYHLPVLRRRQADTQTATMVLERGCLAGAGLAIALAALAPLVLSFTGPSFAPVQDLLPLFIALAALRLPKSALATIALSTGRTHIPMLANAPRLMATPILWWALLHSGDLNVMLLVALTAETVGLLTGLFASRRALQMPRLELFVFALVCALIFAGQIATAALLLGAAIVQTTLGRYAQHRRALA